jgi:threonine/homoserine/homoserine lactone efflux protein
MMPGPVLVGTIAKGYKDKNAGMKIALGHGVVEFPLIGVIAIGLGSFFENQGVMIAIGIIGGSMLVYIGYNMIQMRKEVDEEKEKFLPYHPIIVGVITTVSNPYFFLWWATIGLLLIATAVSFGVLALIVFAVLHWSCDFAWDYFVSFTVFKSKKLWTEKARNIVFGIFGVIMIMFGIYFIVFKCKVNVHW